MRVTTKGRYALRAMISLAINSGEKPVSIKKITEEEDFSPIFLEQIFTKLKKAGLVDSIRGAGGGFFLAKTASEITVKDILEAVEEGIKLTPCCIAPTKDGQDNCAHFNDCRATDFWNTANNYLMEYFNRHTLDSIIKDYKG